MGAGTVATTGARSSWPRRHLLEDIRRGVGNDLTHPGLGFGIHRDPERGLHCPVRNPGTHPRVEQGGERKLDCRSAITAVPFQWWTLAWER